MKVKQFSRKNRGQVLVLAALTTLLVAICLFMTISVSWQVRNRIQLQHAADAKAFSDATAVARAYNSFAYSNRAIAGNIVSMTILHAFHSEVSAASDVYMGLSSSLAAVSAAEFAKSIKCFGPVCITCFKFIHCIHSTEAMLDSIFHGLIPWISGNMGKWIQRTDESFKSAIGSIEKSISAINQFQSMLRLELMLAGFGDKNSEINEINMTSGQPQTDVLSAFSVIDFEDSVAKKKIDLTDIVNAARPGWVRNRINQTVVIPFLLPMFIDSQGPFKKELGKNWVVGAAVQSPMIGGGSGFYQSSPSDWLTGIITNFGGQPASQISGAHISSFDDWNYVGTLKYGNCLWPALGFTPMLGSLSPAIVTSNQQGGKHRAPAGLGFFNRVHTGDQHTVDVESFFDLTVWSTEANKENNYKQPGLYAGFSTDSLSRAFDKTSGTNPWDLKMTVSLPVEASINLENSSDNANSSGSAKAVSKAMAYYHHPGNWKEPPNLWNPFWRAKLHPYDSGDLVHLIMAGGAEAITLLLFQ